LLKPLPYWANSRLVENNASGITELDHGTGDCMPSSASWRNDEDFLLSSFSPTSSSRKRQTQAKSKISKRTLIRPPAATGESSPEYLEADDVDEGTPASPSDDDDTSADTRGKRRRVDRNAKKNHDTDRSHDGGTEDWTQHELQLLDDAIQGRTHARVGAGGMWEAVAKKMGPRTAKECCTKHMERTQPKRAKKPKAAGGTGAGDLAGPGATTPKLKAKPGTLAAKKQMRAILDYEDANHTDDDIFDSTPKRGFAMVEVKAVPIFVPSKKSGSVLPISPSRRQGSERGNLTPGISTDGEADTPGLLKKNISRADADVYIGRTLHPKRGKKQAATSSKKRTVAVAGSRKKSHSLTTDLHSLANKRVVTADDCDSDEEEDYYFSEE
jgi:hypothetical protein